MSGDDATMSGLGLIVAAPPFVRLCLRPPLRRVLPDFLPPERREIKKRPRAAKRFDAAVRREIRAIHALPVAHEDAQAKRPAASVVRPKSTLKSFLADENHGTVQPIRFL
jgi:hypothetical protein